MGVVKYTSRAWGFRVEDLVRGFQDVSCVLCFFSRRAGAQGSKQFAAFQLLARSLACRDG